MESLLYIFTSLFVFVVFLMIGILIILVLIGALIEFFDKKPKETLEEKCNKLNRMKNFHGDPSIFNPFEWIKFGFGVSEFQKPRFVIMNNQIVHFDPMRESTSVKIMSSLSSMLTGRIIFGLLGDIFSYGIPKVSTCQRYGAADSDKIRPLPSDSREELERKKEINLQSAYGEIGLDLINPDRDSEVTDYQSNALLAEDYIKRIDDCDPIKVTNE